MGDVTMIDGNGDKYLVPEENVEIGSRKGWRVEGDSEAQSRLNVESNAAKYEGVGNTIDAAAAAAWRGASLGGTDVVATAIGGEDTRAHLAGLKEAHPVADVVGNVIGSFTGGGAGAAKLGARIAKTAEGASLATKVGRAAAGYGTEGVIQGLGAGVSEVALSEKPLSVELIASALSSNALLAGGMGAGFGVAGKLAQRGLLKARGAMDDIAKRGAGAVGDLASMDAKGLRAAEKLELDAIEAARIPQRSQLADEIKVFRAEAAEQKLFLATKGIKEDGIGKIGKRSLNADKEIDRLLDNPKMLAEKPHMAKAALQKQEAALEDVLAKRETLIAKYAGDESATRMASLDAIPAALERNRGLQKKIAELAAPGSSDRLAQITDARDALTAGRGAGRGVGEQLVQGTAFGMATGAISAIPILGQIPGLAPLLGAKVASMASNLVTGGFGKATAEAAARTSKAVSAFLDVGAKIGPAAPVLATKVLSAVRYATSAKETKADAKASKPTLAKAYNARANEIRSQVQPTAAGPVMRREARLEMAKRLDSVRTVSPILADRLETLAARRLEFLASKLPKRPDLGVLQTGPDRWQPSDMEMRTFARYAAGVEDPGGIEERLAAGTVTPEDAEVMRTVYPERMADITRQIVEKLPELQASLPYARRLALSVFSGVPVDAACHPRILRVLQASFTEEPGSEGGMQAPMPQPAFGSVKNQDATASQQREGLQT